MAFIDAHPSALADRTQRTSEREKLVNTFVRAHALLDWLLLWCTALSLA
jgi:hypothetical protein